MCENDGFYRLFVKGAILVIVFLFALFKPGLLVTLFTYPFAGPVRIYHVLWLLTVLILIKRLIPAFNHKMSLGKIFRKNFLPAGEDSDKKRSGFLKTKKSADSGALRSGLYWLLLLLVMWLWRHVGLLPDLWLYVIIVFFIFMDQFCISVFCPFKWLMRNKCCSTCRINNWGYMMAFSPMIFMPGFWTYSIVFLALIDLIQWEYLYFIHPERFSEIYNANLMCKNCKVQWCTRKKGIHIE